MTVLTSAARRRELALYARRNQPLTWFMQDPAHVRARRAVTDMKLPLRASRQRRLDGDGPLSSERIRVALKPRFVVKRPLVYTDIAPTPTAPRLATHIDGPKAGCGHPASPSRRTPRSAAARPAPPETTSTPKQPVSLAQTDRQRLTSPALIAAGKARCSRYTPGQARPPWLACRHAAAGKAQGRAGSPRPGQASQLGSRRRRIANAQHSWHPGQHRRRQHAGAR